MNLFNRFAKFALRALASVALAFSLQGTANGQQTNQQPQYYFLTTMAMENQGKVLEGNKVEPNRPLQGATHMTKKGPYSGQLWRVIPAGNGYFYLTTMWVEKDGLVLEGNKVGPNSFLKGASHMTRKTGQTGQLWKSIPAGNGYFYLTTKFLEKSGQVLEGNDVGPRHFLGGASFLTRKYGATGQLWRAIPYRP